MRHHLSNYHGINDAAERKMILQKADELGFYRAHSGIVDKQAYVPRKWDAPDQLIKEDTILVMFYVSQFFTLLFNKYTSVNILILLDNAAI